MHKVAGAINGVDYPGGIGSEHTLGPSSCSLFRNEPVVGRSSAWENAPRTQDKALQTASGLVKDKADIVKRFHYGFSGPKSSRVCNRPCAFPSVCYSTYSAESRKHKVTPQCRSFGKALGSVSWPGNTRNTGMRNSGKHILQSNAELCFNFSLEVRRPSIYVKRKSRGMLAMRQGSGSGSFASSTVA